MPAFLHLTLHALLGSLLAWCTRTAPRARRFFFAWPLWLGLLYAVAVLLPVAAHTFRFYPDFSLGYAFDPVLYPWAEQAVGSLGAAACASNLLVFVLGYAVTRSGLLRQGRLLAATVPLLSLVALGVGSWAAGERGLLRADYASFWRGLAEPWAATPSGGLTAVAYFAALVGLRYVERRWRGRDPTLFGQF